MEDATPTASGSASSALERQPTRVSASDASAIRDMIHSLQSPIVRAYSRVRFTILRQLFLEEIGQYLPRSGDVLDLGGGFGLFSLFYAITKPGLRIQAVDLDVKQVAAASESAARLGLTDVTYVASDATKWTTRQEFDASYMLDLLHHLPQASVPGFLADVTRLLRRSGILVIKDVADRPSYKMLFTLLLDRLLVGWTPFNTGRRPSSHRYLLAWVSTSSGIA